ncbi:hypothetical protein BGZ50_000888 [Haplosporangium sp. Z 11]|nr:hypothetical protein BGZ50_000888 [Haplosporangium sp. Z 11]
MALEFPLTEIHGVDLTVPKPHRRPKAISTLPAGPGSLNTSTSPLFSINKKTNPHSNVQSTASSAAPSAAATGAGTSSIPVTSRHVDSMPSNCFFHKADIMKGLPFPDNTFDYCHVRLVLWGYRLNSFPDLLNELIRVTKKGGWIEFVDMDPCIMKATETGTRINEWIKTGLIHSNMDPDLVKNLPQFLREFSDATVNAAMRDDDILGQGKNGKSAGLPTALYGLDHLKTTKVSLPFGPWGGQVGKLWQYCFIAFLRDLEPMMIDAALSGLIMDQYHRQCQQEMQDLAEAAAAQSSDQQQEVTTNFDQRLCTHKAWTHLIHQLIRDSKQSATLPPNSGLKSPSSASSIMEMRSYTNFHIAYAQKVDLVELKQQLLLQQLEKVILNRSSNIASPSKFSLPSTATFGAVHSREQTPKRQSDDDVHEGSAQALRLASTLREKLPSSNLHQQYVSSGSGTTGDDDPIPLTVSSMEAHNRSNRNNSREDQALSTVSPSSSVVAPTPTSVAALSIRSSSRNSNKNNSVPGTVSPKIGKSALAPSASVCHSPRIAANGFSRAGPVQGGLSSPKPSSTIVESRDDGVRSPFEPDYFNYVPVDNPSAYHQQRDNQQHQQQHQQQQMNTVKQKTSPLIKVLSPSAGLLGAAGASSDATRNASMLTGAEAAAAEEYDDHQSSEQQEDVATLIVDTEHRTTSGERSELQPQRPAKRLTMDEIVADIYEDEEGSDVILLQDVQDDNSQEEFGTFKENESPEGTVGMVAKHQVITSVVRPDLHLVPIKSFSAEIEHTGQDMEGNDEGQSNDENMIKVINRVSRDETLSEQQEQTDSDIVDESQLQMLQVDDEGEVTVMTAPENQEEKGSASIIAEECIPKHHSVVSVPSPISQDKDKIEQVQTEQSALANETSDLETREPIPESSLTFKPDNFIENREVASEIKAMTEVEVESKSPALIDHIPVPVPTPAPVPCPVTEPEVSQNYPQDLCPHPRP